MFPRLRVESSRVSVLAGLHAIWSACSFPTVLICLYGFPFSDNVSAYCLHIAEDDGEVDTDFPPLDSNEPIHKFGFSTLALVEKYSSPGLTSKESLFVRMWVLLALFLSVSPWPSSILHLILVLNIRWIMCGTSAHMTTRRIIWEHVHCCSMLLHLGCVQPGVVDYEVDWEQHVHRWPLGAVVTRSLGSSIWVCLFLIKEINMHIVVTLLLWLEKLSSPTSSNSIWFFLSCLPLDYAQPFLCLCQSGET